MTFFMILIRRLCTAFVVGMTACAAGFGALSAAAANPLTDFMTKAGDTAYGTTGGAPDLPVIVGRIVQQVILLTGVILFAIFIYAGITWMTASGSEEKVTKAKNLLQNAFWGMLITGGAYVIASFVTRVILEAALNK